MDKIICDVCGTSYPENASQCPICGYAKPAKAKAAPSAEGESGGYNYVKGGRFSSGNVRRRNVERGITPESEDSLDEYRSSYDKGYIAGLATIVILSVVIAILLFFVIKTIVDRPEAEPYNYVETTQQAQNDDNPTNCVSLHTDKVEAVLANEGDTWQIQVIPEPVSAIEPITFTSVDPQIASVNSEGLVTGLSYGQTTIVVKCGDASLLITIKCTFGDSSGQQWGLNRKEFTLSNKGETWDLYSKTSTVAKNKIRWTSDDTSVATIEDGIVTAVGHGTTTVHAEYNNTIYSCTVHCNVKDESGNDTQDKGNENKDDQGDDNKSDVDPSIDLDSLKISHSDVTIKVGEAFNLTLKDANGNVATVNWFVSRAGYVAIYGNTVKGQVSTGNDYVTVRAVYGNKTFECKVRVK